MHQYPKNILSIQQQVQSYIDAGMNIASKEEAEKAMMTIGYYRLRGYCFQWYNNAENKYYPETAFQKVLELYRFDTELSRLLFGQYRIIRQEHSAGDFAVEKGSFSQEYFVYFKKK